jgi:colicin import membrane protein
MAQRTKAECQGFVEALGHEVASLRAGFRRAHKNMARMAKADRRADVNHLKKTVGWMRREFALDLAGAHRAWCGPSPGELRAKAEAERRAKAEAEFRAKEEGEHQRREAETRAKEEAAREPAPPKAKEEAGRPGKKKG